MAVKKIRYVLLAVFALNLSVASVRFGLAVLTGSSGILADGFHALADSGANMVALAGLWLAYRPADKKYPYGYARFENLAIVVIGCIIITMAITGAGLSAVERLASSSYPSFSWLAFYVLSATLVVSAGVALGERFFGMRYNSKLLGADSFHTALDAFASTTVLFGFGASALGLGFLDPVVALVIVVFIFWIVGKEMIVKNARILAQKAFLDPEKVRAVATSVPGVLGCHSIQTFGDPDSSSLALHISIWGDEKSPHDEYLVKDVIMLLAERLGIAAGNISVQWEKRRPCPNP